MSDTLQLRFAPAVQSMFDFIAPHREWIENAVGASLSETVTIELERSLAQTAVGRFLPDVSLNQEDSQTYAGLVQKLNRWEIPAGRSPRIVFSRSSGFRGRCNSPTVGESAWSAEWRECPIALWLGDLAHAVVAVNVPYVSYSNNLSSSWKNWVIVNKAEITSVLRELEGLAAVRKESIFVYNAPSIPLPAGSYDWDSLVLDSAIIRLVRRDFETFFEREAWFRNHGLPFRRGYLFYGSPGNGKTSVIRVMAAHPAVAPYMLQCDAEVTDGCLTVTFDMARANAPSIIILEDIDRLFGPRPEGADQRVSLRHLLNCLDGLQVNDGVIVIATANDPTTLDPAILKRPGRFDRVVAFNNPTPDLRLRYLLKLATDLTPEGLGEVVIESDGFSFAQLREMYTLGAQLALDEERNIRAEDLVLAAQTLKAETASARRATPEHGAGFGSAVGVIRQPQKPGTSVQAL